MSENTITKKKEVDFTDGKILGPLVKFVIPIFLSLLIQALYSAVDLLIVGQFGSAIHVSGVSLGINVVYPFQAVIISLAIGITVQLGHFIGEGKRKEAGNVVGTGIWIFIVVSIVVTFLLFVFTKQWMNLMQCPEESFDQGLIYTKICALGTVFTAAYNVLSAVFKGLGDSKTPLLAVGIACICNIGGDLLLVGAFHMAAAGAAIATVISQGISVVVALAFATKKGLPFDFSFKENFKYNKEIGKRILRIGLPLVLMEICVASSFCVTNALSNSLGLAPSAGAGIGHKLVLLILLAPQAFCQGLSSFVAQNTGARKLDRGIKALKLSVFICLLFSCVAGYVSWFHGDWLASAFSTDSQVIEQAVLFLRAYAIDTFLTSFLFCLIGFYNGTGITKITFTQGIVGVIVRVPAAFIMRYCVANTSLFYVGLSTPISSTAQIIICLLYLFIKGDKMMRKYDADYEQKHPLKVN